MKRFNVVFTGRTSLLMHSDNIEWGEQIKKYRATAEAKKESVAGDDRSPAWSWIGCLYSDGQNVAMQSENVMRSMMEGGAGVGTGKGQKTFKSQTQSGCMCDGMFLEFTVNGKQIPMAPILALVGNKDFDAHIKAAQSLGFSLHVKRAKIGKAKHIRVRPMFSNWVVRGSLIVTDDALTLDIMKQIWKQSGQYKGFCDWRPGCPTPGPYGMFDAEIQEVR